MKLKFLKRILNKNAIKLNEKKPLSQTSSTEPDTASVVSDSENECNDEYFTGKDSVYQPSTNSGKWDYIRNKQNMTTEERWSDKHLQRVNEMWELTQEEQDRLLDLKQCIADIDYWKNDPYEVVRFLKEVQCNVTKAERLFRADHKWRTENKIDALLDAYQPPPISKYFPIATLKGCDVDGDPIHVQRPGAADVWGLFQRLGEEETYNLAVYYREMDLRGPWHQKYEQEHGRPVKYFTVILDLEGLSKDHAKTSMIPLTKRVLEMAQQRYPSIAKRVIVLRAPRIFRYMWAVAQHFIQDNVKELIVFTNPDNYLEVLDKYVDRSVLPPCICEGGQGEATIGFENVRFEGGKLPPAEWTDSQLLQHLRGKDNQASEAEPEPTMPNRQGGSFEVTLTPIVAKQVAKGDAHVITTPLAAGCFSAQ